MRAKASSEQSLLWRRIASDLMKPTRSRRVVNLSRLNRVTKENEVVIIPGKLLGSGDLSHKLTVAAYQYSDSALEKLKKGGCTIVALTDMLKEKTKGKRVRIIG